MRNKPFEVLIIILISELLLVGYSFYYKSTGTAFIKENVRFLSPDKLADFSLKDANKNADSLLKNYLSNTLSDDKIIKRTNLSKIGPKKQNAFLVNPVTENGSALDNFFKSLLHQKDSTTVRIAHYGDSQLEGDRMSYIVREKFHEKFGGSGIGYVPLKDLSPVSYVRKSSGNWAKYTVFHDRSSKNDYGISGAVFRFSKFSVHQSDDADNDTSSSKKDTHQITGGKPFYNASVSMKMGSQYAYNSVSILYGHATDKCIVNYYDNASGERVKTDTLAACTKVCMHKTQLGGYLNVKVEFAADNSPDFYGMYFDSGKGVQVDNYAIRGHSGDGLMMINDDELTQMLDLSNTKLVIFQYGANVVPYIHSDEACEWISGIYYKLFMKFKKAKPDISILVIGAGDMAKGGEGSYSSYPWLPKITEAQKRAALKAGCAYWDLFNMMGGLNSIITWTDKKLAVTNGHFSEKGQKIIANELVEALMVEYNIYVHKQRMKK